MPNPTTFTPPLGSDPRSSYDNGDVLPTAAEAVAWVNELVRRIDTSE